MFSHPNAACPKPVNRPSRGHSRPEAERIGPCVTIGWCGESIAVGGEDDVDLVMGSEKSPRLPGRVEAAPDLFPSPRWPVATLDPVVEVLLGPVISIGCPAFDRFDVASQFVGDDDPWLAKLNNQPCRKAPDGTGIAPCLLQNIKCVAVGIHRTPQPMFQTIERDHNLVHVPFVVRAWPSTAAANGKMRARPVDQRRMVLRLTITPSPANRSSTSAVFRAKRW